MVKNNQRDDPVPVPAREGALQKAGSFIDKYAFLITAIASGLYILLFGAISILRYNAFDFNDFDLAIYSQVSWNIIHGSIQSSILGIPFLGNHLDIIMFLIAPLYALWQSALMLLLLQTVAIGLGALLVYKIAQDAIDKRFGLLFALLYLLYPALHYVNHFEFHPDAFAILFLLGVFFFLEREKFWPFLISALLCILCKENVSMGVFFFGLYIILFKRKLWSWGAIISIASVLWLVAGMKVMHHYNMDVIKFNLLYSHLGKSFPEVLSNIVMHPVSILKLIFAPENIDLLYKLLLPLAFVSILAPKVLFIAIPFFLQQFLSLRPTDHTIFYHYAAKLIPFMLVSSIYGVRTLINMKYVSRHRIAVAAALVACVITGNLKFGLFETISPMIAARYIKQPIDVLKERLVKEVPANSPVIATFEFLPKLSRRQSLYSFHHVYMGAYTLSEKQYLVPADTEYALVDFDDYITFNDFYLRDNYRNLRRFFEENDWGLVEAADNIAFFKRGYKTDDSIFNILTSGTITPPESPAFNIDKSILVAGYALDPKAKAGGKLHIRFIYQALAKTDKDYWISFKLVDADNNVVHYFHHPICYRVYPTYAWGQFDAIEENIWVLIPEDVRVKELWLKSVVFDRSSLGREGGTVVGASIEASTRGFFDSDGWMNLGSVKVENR